MFKKRRLPSPAKQATFLPQAYPLYAWGVWMSVEYDTEEAGISRTRPAFHEDRLLVVGWQQCGSSMEPVVLDYNYGPVPLVELTGHWPCKGVEGYEYLLDEDGERVIQVIDDFYLTEISISEPGKDVLEATKKFAKLIFNLNNYQTFTYEDYPTVVDEEVDLEV